MMHIDAGIKKIIQRLVPIKSNAPHENRNPIIIPSHAMLHAKILIIEKKVC
jgi:hypothetical protein